MGLDEYMPQLICGEPLGIPQMWSHAWYLCDRAPGHEGACMSPDLRYDLDRIAKRSYTST